MYSPQISLEDLRPGPVILIGAFDNDWTLRLTGPLRYRFQRDADFNIASIRDEQNPARNDWKVDWRTPYLELIEDYALVSRVSDSTTGETVIVAADITKLPWRRASFSRALDSRKSRATLLATGSEKIFRLSLPLQGTRARLGVVPTGWHKGRLRRRHRIA